MARVLVAGILAAAGARGAAQERPQLKRPEETPAEKPAAPAKKKVKGPRAVGILQLDAKGNGTLIPVAILIDGHFYDASAYKADPIPMALDSGTVYEAEQAGDAQGLFTVSGALHSKDTGSTHPWLGTGTFLPQGTVAPKTTRKAEDVPVGIDSGGDDGPPRLTKPGAGKAGPDKTASAEAGKADAPAPGAASKTDADKSSAQTGSAPAGTAAAPPAQAPSQPPSKDQGNKDQPAKGKSGKDESASDRSSSDRSASDPSSSDRSGENYRPTLRRGKPTEAVPEDKPDSVVKPGGSAAGASAAGATASPAQGSGPIRMVPAISDGGGPDPAPYKYFWKPGEEDERGKQMQALAENEVLAYAAALARNHISATPVSPKTAARRKAELKQAKPVLENVQFHGYDLWRTSQAVMILTAEARIPGGTEAGAGSEPYSVSLVARTDIYGDLRKIFSSVTDKFHLDVTPKLELIDVVDADGDGRGELLFRETGDAGTGYIIYRATADKLWKMFDSLSAE
jgi:hypothetical protein